MSVYLVIDNTSGVVVNAITYDGQSPYEEEGCSVIAQSDAPQGAWIGWTYSDGTWNAPVDDPVE